MKIAIVTFCFDNYGTRLQTYALSRVLAEAKFDVEVINLEMLWNVTSRAEQMKRLLTEYRWRTPLVVFQKMKWFIQCRKLNKRDNTELIRKRELKFEEFSKRYIPYTRYYTCGDVRNGMINHYDIYIVGSDQIWNYELTDSLDIYFLDFISSSKNRISYAASFGVTKIPMKMRSKYKNWIDNIDTLLVREKEAKDIAKSLGRDDAKVVLDPTLLLSSTHWNNLLSEAVDDNTFSEDYILVYSLNSSLKIYKEAELLAERENKKLLIIKRSFCPPEIPGSIELYDIAPMEFLRLIKNASCVITNSYHALIFSINFNTNFYAYLEKTDNVNSRLLSILSICKIEGHTYYETDHLPQKIGNIDYAQTNDILNKEREKSKSLLLRAAGSMPNKC